ncbi:MAG: hypothetical protein GY751_17825, partial [Bacteroidetes bacterium]|nr:hypothetical protein [Bacteroidota bacterium]
NITIGGLTQTVNTSIGDVTVHASSSYFTFSSSNTSVATVSNEGVAMVLDAGSAVITAKLGETDADGSLTITGVGEAVLPPQSPTQTRSADSVIALWSNDYDERPVDTWNARYEWSTAEEDFVDVDGDDMIRYRDLNFVGIEFANPTIDVSQMTHFHMNIWTPDETAGGEFKVLLADAGPDGMLGTGDDTNDELTFTSPLLQTEEWVTIEVPLSQFAGLTSRTKLVQMVLSGTLPNVFVDNVYFYIAGSSSSGGDCTPLDPSMTAFPIDFENCENFSGVFEAGDGVTGYPNSNPDLNGNASSRVYQLNKVSGAAWYSGIFHIFPSNYDMTDNKVFKMKIWSPKPNVIVRFQIEKEGGGAVTYNKTATVATANTWTELEFDFSDQPLIDGFTVYDKFVIIPDDQDNGPSDGSVYYIDDIELTTGSGGGDEPTAAAPAPTHDAANVISVFSDAYTNIGIVDFNPGWGQSGTVDQVSVDGDNTLKYSNFNYQGTVFNMSEDLSAMEYVHIDMWTADATDVKFTPISGTGEFLVGLTPINSGSWTSYDIPVGDFTGVSFNDIFQLKFDGQGGMNPSNIWLDNIYFYKEGGSAFEPTVAAPAPTHDAANVISVFSDAYTNIGIADYNPGWGQSGTVDQVSVDGDNTLKYSNFNYQGTVLSMSEDLSAMEYVHIDMWTADATDVKFTPI